MIYRFLGIVCFVGMLASCSSDPGATSSDGSSVDNNVDNTLQTKEERQLEIAQMEKEIAGMAGASKNQLLDEKAERLLKRYRDYISSNPRDSITAEYLFKAADLSLGVGKPEASINYLNRLITDFPSFRKVVEMMLFKGFIYETYMNDYARAKQEYEALIERYPNHRLAKDAQASIDNLSLSQEELLEKFKRMNPEQEPI